MAITVLLSDLIVLHACIYCKTDIIDIGMDENLGSLYCVSHIFILLIKLGMQKRLGFSINAKVSCVKMDCVVIFWKQKIPK
jgi:hypothetical protein